MTDLLLQPHDLEPLEIRQLPSPPRLLVSLGPSALLPLLLDLDTLPFLPHFAGPRSPR